jgi:hypothetical protein
MHEGAVILMRAAPGWFEHQTSNATYLFQNRDAMVTIFPNGSWRCTRQGSALVVRKGSVNNLEQFLNEFAVCNAR